MHAHMLVVLFKSVTELRIRVCLFLEYIFNHITPQGSLVLTLSFVFRVSLSRIPSSFSVLHTHTFLVKMAKAGGAAER